MSKKTPEYQILSEIRTLRFWDKRIDNWRNVQLSERVWNNFKKAMQNV